MLTALGTGDIVIPNIIFQHLVVPSVYLWIIDALTFHEIFHQIIGPEPGFAFPAIHQWISEPGNMAGNYPGFWVHEYSRIHTHIVWAFLDKLFPPCFFDIIL